jgi:hypothetical protein
MGSTPARATVHAYLGVPEIGSEVSVKYLPEHRRRMERDSRREHYLLTGLVLWLRFGIAVGEILSPVTTHGPGNLP